ncbi:MAG: S1C family serine protease [Candidatus Babeliales bacterium]
MPVMQTISNVMYGVIALALAAGVVTVQLQQKSIQESLKELHQRFDAIRTESPEVPHIVERVVAHNHQPWSDLQATLKDSVVQIFSQIAEVNLLQPQKPRSQHQAYGSGFFINDEGEIITNAHVVDQAAAVWIQIPSLGKRQLDVDIIGVSPDRDMALLKLRPEGIALIKQVRGEIPYLQLGDSDRIHRADEILTLGYPLGQQGLKSTKGVVSGREQHLIQIDAAINPGNSGGPSINVNGEVVGINTAIAREAQNVGYIIPANELKVILADLRTVPLLRRPFLGILFNNASESLTDFLGNPKPGGLYVVDVIKGSPLHKAGVLKGDMIYEINGHQVDMYGELSWTEDKISIIDYVSQLRLGEEVGLVVYRNGSRKNLTFSFEQSDALPIHKIYPGYEDIDYEIVGGMLVQQLTVNHLGLLVNMAPSLAKYAEMKYQKEPALLVTHVFPDSPAHRCRSIGIGAIINKINDEPVQTLDELRCQLAKSFETNNVTIESADGVYLHFPFNDILKEERRLSRIWSYGMTTAMTELVSGYEVRLAQAEQKYMHEQMQQQAVPGQVAMQVAQTDAPVGVDAAAA